MFNYRKGSSPRDGELVVHAEMVTNFSRKVSEHYYTIVETALINMPVGQTLCVHETTWGSDATRDDQQFHMSFVMHTIARGGRCDNRIGKTQYGPKTQEMQDEIDQGNFK